MIKTNCYLIVLLALMTSCNSQRDIIPHIVLGDSEQVWHSKQKQLISEGLIEPRLRHSGDTAYLFKWHLADTSYVMHVEFNSDMENKGPLLSYSMQLVEDTMSTVSTGSIKPLPQGFQFFRPSTIRSITTRIEKTFGRPDSLANASRELWYKKDEYDIVITLPEPMVSVQKDTMYNPLWVQVYSKTYKRDYDAFLKSQQEQLRPEDVFSVDFNYREVTQHDQSGFVYPALKITAVLESSNSYDNQKLIRSAKGTLRIKDAYGDILFELPNSEYTFYVPLCCGKSTVFPKDGPGWTLPLQGRPELNKLRQAVQMGSQMAVEFEPQAVLFEDGTVLR